MHRKVSTRLIAQRAAVAGNVRRKDARLKTPRDRCSARRSARMSAMSLRDWLTIGRAIGSRGPSPESEPVALVLYTRRRCPLCDEMKHEVEALRIDAPHTLRIIDVDTDPALVELHGRSVPVLAIDGRVAFKGRCTARDLVRKIDRALAAKRGG